jgi:hypothetical protein
LPNRPLKRFANTFPMLAVYVTQCLEKRNEVKYVIWETILLCIWATAITLPGTSQHSHFTTSTCTGLNPIDSSMALSGSKWTAGWRPVFEHKHVH